MVERNGPEGNRRWFLRGAGKVGLVGFAGYAGWYEGDEILAEIPSSSEVYFDPRQTQRLKEQRNKTDGPKSACLVLGGLTVRSGKVIADTLGESLAPLGPVGYVQYGLSSIDPASIAHRMHQLQEQFGVEEFSFYGHSIGPHALGEVMSLPGSDFKLNTIFADCTPPRSGYGFNPDLENVLAQQPLVNDPIFPALFDQLSYGNPFEPGTSPPRLFWDQVQSAADERNIQYLADIVRKQGTRVISLAPRELSADTVVDQSRALPRMEALFAPNWKLEPVDGFPQKHGNVPENATGYNLAVQKALAA